MKVGKYLFKGGRHTLIPAGCADVGNTFFDTVVLHDAKIQQKTVTWGRVTVFLCVKMTIVPYIYK